MTRSLAVGLALAGLCLPAGADTADLMIKREVQAQTPRCEDHGEFAFIGTVSGELGGQPSKTAVFVGCFPTQTACVRWTMFASGRLRGRIVYMGCDRR